MANEKIIIQLASPERKYVKTYHDFLDNSFLTAEEQMIFIVLKSYVDFKEDGGEVFPGIETICKRAKMSKPRVIRTINSLVKKGIVKKVQRGLTKTNIYTLADYPAMWTCDNLDELAAVVENDGIKPLTPEQHIAALEKMGYAIEIKAKGLATEPTKAQKQDPKHTNNLSISDNTVIPAKSQGESEHTEPEQGQQDTGERYTQQDIEELFDYSDLTKQCPEKKKDIETVFDILYDTLNTTKQTVRIGGEDKPTMAVIGRLMKLEPHDIIHTIEKYHEQTDRIKNVRAYLLTVLYHSREQSYLDLMNLGHHNGDF